MEHSTVRTNALYSLESVPSIQAAGSTSVPLFQAANGSSTDPPIPAAAAAAATTTTAIASTAADGPTGSSRRWAAQGAPSMSQAMSRQQYMRQYQRRYAVRFVPAHTIVEGGLMVALSMFEDHMPEHCKRGEAMSLLLALGQLIT
eukprot:1157406-Pelagomonas_calceolata.AAC.2